MIPRTRIKYLCLMHGIGQIELAKRAKCSPATIRAMIRTGVPPERADVLQRLAQVFGVKVSDLYAKNSDEADPLSLTAAVA